ncbi:MAG TPA: DUF4350 domain-containing protein [Tepidisphaeraceae bacterium]|jgi:hypothetical protein
MIRRVLLMLAVIAVMAGIIAFYQLAAVRARTGADSPLFSTRRYDPYGTAAIRDLLVERGIPVRTLERPNLHPEDRGVLIEVLDLPGERIRTDQLLEWISKGNTVVQYTRHYSNLMAALKMAATTRPFQPNFDQIEAAEGEGISPEQTDFDQVHARISSMPGAQLAMWQPMKLTAPTTNPFWKTLARTDDRRDAVVAAQLRIGRGKLIIVGAPEPALNGMLDKGNNLDFLLSVVGNGPVLLDEWSHGLGKEPTIMGLLHEVGLLPLLFQLAGIVILYVWSTSGFARRDYTAHARRRSGAEQIQTLGFLYERSFNQEMTRERITAEVKQRIASALRCAPEDLSKTAGQIKGNLGEKIDQLLKQLDSLRDDKAFAQVLTASHEIQREVRRERRAIR